ncbi:MotA/TolQ/ExbB proton channel family protein [Conchiformibius steedae]
MFSGINLVFTLILIVVFSSSIWKTYNGKQTKFTQAAPTLLTSIGIFGTFFGIVLSLLDFDGIDNIKQQLNVIISGMQTAFVTSVTGLGLSVLLKVISLFQSDGDSDDDIGSEELIEKFIKQADNTEKMALLLNKLARSIVQDNENSILGQVRLLRVQLIDKQINNQKLLETQVESLQKIFDWTQQSYKEKQQFEEKLWVAMANITESLQKIFDWTQQSYKEKQQFEEKLWVEMANITETLAKSATETIIKALKDVISDFNQNLTEQFGENFKELNQAVFKLVEWQENYKHQLLDMTEQYKLGVQAVNGTRESVQSIELAASAIPQHMDKLSAIIAYNQNQLNELGRHLQAFADIKDAAVAALPEIQEHITLVLNNMNNGSMNVENAMRNAATEFQTQTSICLQGLADMSRAIEQDTLRIHSKLEEVVSSIEQIKQGMEKWLQNLESAIKQVQKTFEQSLSEMTEEQKRFFRKQMADVEATYEKMKDGIYHLFKETQDEIYRLLKETQENMHKRQEESIRDMGKSLVSITREFEKDYKHLTEQMGKVSRTIGGEGIR